MDSLSNETSIKLAEFYFYTKQIDLAKKILQKHISSGNANSKCFELLAYISGNEGDQEELLRLLQVACSFDNASAEVNYYLGKELIKAEYFEDGINYLNKSIKIGGEFFEGCFDLGFAYVSLKKYYEAEPFFKKALRFKPDNMDAKYNLAKLYGESSGRNKESIDLYNQILNREPHHDPSLHGMGALYEKNNQFEEAIQFYKKAIEIKPTSDTYWLDYLSILDKVNRLNDALETFDTIKQSCQNSFQFKLIEGMIKLRSGKTDEALLLFNLVLQVEPKNFKAWLGKAIAEFNLSKNKNSLTSIEKAIEYKNNHAYAWFYKGMILQHMGLPNFSLSCYKRAHGIDPKMPMVTNNYINAKLSLFDWENIDYLIDEALNTDENFLDPTTLLYLCDEPKIILENNSRWSKSRYKKVATEYISPVKSSPKIKIAYFSSDFRNHAVVALTRDLYKFHDREKFEVLGFSINSKKSDFITEEIKPYFDNFIDITDLNDFESVRLIRNFDIDIAVDLNGHTMHARTNIFLNRIAKTQINFIGYPNTMGSKAYDFIIADDALIAEDELVFYSEKIIRLSPCFQPNSVRKFNKKKLSRTDFDIPEESFVFCCFNLNLKISKQIFNTWLEILDQTDNTVLWIYVENYAKCDLTKRICDFGIKENRVIFADRSCYDDYLNRFALADLFLDTYPYNGGTTLSDSLISELPVLTLSGKSFHSRMGKSVIGALGLDFLIANSIMEYKSKAIDIANNKNLYREITNNLKFCLLNSTVFDPIKYTKQFESKIIAAHFSH